MDVCKSYIVLAFSSVGACQLLTRYLAHTSLASTAQHNSRWEGGMITIDPKIAIQASAEARADTQKSEAKAATQRKPERQKTISALLKAQTDAMTALARLE